MRQMLVVVIVLQFLSAVFLAYPTWRLTSWLGSPALVVGLLTALMFFSQLIVRFVLRRRTEPWVRLVRQCADSILGVAPVLLVVTLVLEGAIGFGFIAPQSGAMTGLGVCLLAGVWAFRNGWRPRVVEVEVPSGKVDQPVSFVQISDVHIGSRSGDFLQAVMAKVVAIDPDFLCITGDLIDETDVQEHQLGALASFKKPIYFCSGNHEHYEDWPEIRVRLQRLGVQILRGAVVNHDEIQVLGFDDHSAPDFLRSALAELEIAPDRFSLLLFHRPLGLQHAADHGIDLQISGHTHNGQIKPFHWLVKTQFDYLKGMHHERDTRLYVNEGTGTWGPVMRLGTRSEITSFRIVPSG